MHTPSVLHHLQLELLVLHIIIGARKSFIVIYVCKHKQFDLVTEAVSIT